MMIYLYGLLIVIMLSSQVVDVLGYKFRCNKNSASWINSIAISGVLFYLARLGVMFYATLLAVLKEVTGLSIVTIDKLSITGLSLALIYLLLARKHVFLKNLILKIVSKVRMFKVDHAPIFIDYQDFSESEIDLKLAGYSFLTNFFVLFCSLLPINLTLLFPGLAMTLVYVSQILTVVAGFSWYALQEPKIIDYINSGNFDVCYHSLFLGKILSVVFTIMALICIVLWL